MIGVPEYYPLAALFLTAATFLAVYFKRNNALLALSISSIVLALAILIAPGGDFVVWSFSLRVLGNWRLYEITAVQLKLLMTVTLIVGVVIVNQLWKRLGVKGGA